MMMMIRSWGVVVLFFLLPFAAFSQDKDFGIWYGISAEARLTARLDIDLSTNIRTFNNASKIEEIFVEGGVAFNLNKYFTIAGSYRITENIEDNNLYYFRHKVFLDFKGTVPAGDFRFACRLKFQTRSRTYIENEDDLKTDYTGRIKFKALYKTPSFPVNPFIYAESFFPLFSDKSRTIEKNRLAAGIEFRIAKKHSIEAEYLFQRDYLPSISDINIISINYNIKF